MARRGRGGQRGQRGGGGYHSSNTYEDDIEEALLRSIQTPSVSQVSQLTTMGYPSALVKDVLDQTNNNIDAALSFLLAMEIPPETATTTHDEKCPTPSPPQIPIRELSDDSGEEGEAECSICTDKMSFQDMLTLECPGAHSFCGVCLHHFVSDRVRENRPPGCPIPGCRDRLSEGDVMAICTGDETNLWDAYSQCVLRVCLAQMGDMVWCPTPDCGNGVAVPVFAGVDEGEQVEYIRGRTPPPKRRRDRKLVRRAKRADRRAERARERQRLRDRATNPGTYKTPGTYLDEEDNEEELPVPPQLIPNVIPAVECEKCGLSFCPGCRSSTYHPFLSCVGVKQAAKESIGTGAAEKSGVWLPGVRPCPKCGTPIIKDGGCSHMHCQACGADYTWGGAADEDQDAAMAIYEDRMKRKERKWAVECSTCHVWPVVSPALYHCVHCPVPVFMCPDCIVDVSETHDPDHVFQTLIRHVD